MSAGVIAASGDDAPLAVAPPPVYQSRSVGAASAGSGLGKFTMTVNMPAGVQDKDLILVGCAMSRANDTDPTLDGFNLLFIQKHITGTAYGYLAIFGKIAGASEPTSTTWGVTTNGTAQGAYIAERWSGVKGLPTVFAGTPYSTAGTFTMSQETTTSFANSIVHSFIGGRGPSNGDVVHTWGGGAVGQYDTASGQIAFIQNAVQTLADTGSTTHTAQVTNNQGNPISIIASIVIEPPNVVGGEVVQEPAPVPYYIPAGHEDKYNTDTGMFNANSTNMAGVLASLDTADTELSEWLVAGDSFAEGWTSLEGLNMTEDRYHAFPIMMRDRIRSVLGLPLGSDGHIRTQSAALITRTADGRWTPQSAMTGSLNGTNSYGHYVGWGNATVAITCSPLNPGRYFHLFAKDAAGILYSIDGGPFQSLAGGGTLVPRTYVIDCGTDAMHTLTIKPEVQSAWIYVAGATLSKTVGFTVHNVAQGGSRSYKNGPAQPVWSDMSSGYDNMAPFYSHSDMHDNVDVVIVELGGNDMQTLPVDYNALAQGLITVGNQWPSAAKILMGLVESPEFDGDYTQALPAVFQAALDAGWAIYDAKHSLGDYNTMKANGWCTDAYGHLSTEGAAYFGEKFADAILAACGLI